MKKLVLIVIALAAMQVTAQEHKKGEKQERYQRFKNFTPKQIAELKTKKMTLHLDLTEAQQREIKKIQLANAKKRISKREKFKMKKEKDIGEKTSKESRFKMMNERLDKQISNKKEMKRILSKEQFKKWEKGNQRGHNKQKAMKQKVRKGKEMKQRSKSGRLKKN